MNYFPILNVPGFIGKTIVYNYPPVKYNYKEIDKYVIAVNSDSKEWNYMTLCRIPYMGSLAVDQIILLKNGQKSNDTFLFLSESPIDRSAEELIAINNTEISIPTSRATIGIYQENDIDYFCSYQGEIEAFRQRGNCLTFTYLNQRGNNIVNYIILMNLEENARKRKVRCRFEAIENKPDSTDNTQVEVEVYTNSMNTILTDKILPNRDAEYSLICEEAVFIPLFITIDSNTNTMTMEHTHPPASMALHGNRWKTQAKIKSNWIK